MGKVENNEIENYIRTYIPTIFDSSPLFEKAFGANFAKRRIDENLSKVYTNEYHRNMGGYFEINTGNLVLCTKNKSEPILTIEALQSNQKQFFNLLHEVFHAIVKKNTMERLRFRISR